MRSIPELPLCSTDDNKTIPAIGFGTAEYPLGVSSDATIEILLHAIKLGYRHFDTASLYKTEKYIGEAISNALSLGLIKSRSELFITSKLWINDTHPHRVVPALQKSLENLKLEYLDLYLIHHPVSLKPGNSEPGDGVFPFNKEDLLPLDIKGVWEAMEECQKLGLTKSIGVSNFSRKKLGILLSTAKIPPAVNQIELNPLWQQKKMREFCEQKGIRITVFSPLGARGTIWGSNKVMENEVLKKIADAKGKTLAQVCLRWVYEQGVSVIVKSYNKERMKENLDILDWKLSAEESDTIGKLPQCSGFIFTEAFVHENGPYKSADDYWDGELNN